MNRNDFEGKTPVAHHAETKTVVYLFDEARNSFIAFSGKSSKHTWWYKFDTKESAQEYIANYIKNIIYVYDAKQVQKAAFVRAMKVGDVLMASWGYEQTNIDYYQVVKLSGQKSVIIRKIERVSEPTGLMTGKCVPAINQFCKDSPELRRQVSNCGNWVSVDNIRCARLMKKDEFGLYQSNYFSSTY